MEAGEGSDGQGGPTPPEEEQMRLGRARVARGLLPDQGGEADVPDGPTGTGTGVAAGGQVPDTTPGTASAVPPGTAAGPDDIAPSFRPWSEQAPSGSGPIQCHFLRSVGPDGRLADAETTAVPTHRCAAFGDPLPLSLRQQELVCLQRVHVSCPRYVRGTVLANEGAAPTASDEKKAGFPLMAVTAVVLVVAALGILLTGPVLGVLPFGGASRATQAIAVVSPSPVETATLAPTATPVPSPSPTPLPSPTAAATPTVAPTQTPAPTPAATSSWPPGATASRMNLLVPCTDQPNCYVYTVRGAGQNGSQVGDALSAVATFFGVDLAKIRAMNPWLAGSGVINAGDKLKIPPPTR